MALTNDDLLAISQLLDVKLDAKIEPLKVDMRELKNELQEIKSDITGIKLDIENDVKPAISLLAENYVPAAKKYEKASSQIEAMQSDIDIMKKVIAEHSEKLQKIS